MNPSPLSKTVKLYVCNDWLTLEFMAVVRELREHSIFLALLKSVPGLEERLMNAESEDEINILAAYVSKPFFIDTFQPLYPTVVVSAAKGRLKCKV